VYQRPHPPLWYPTTNPNSIPRLGEQGYNVLFGFGFNSPSLDVVREQATIFFENYRASAARGSTRYALAGVTPKFGLMRHVFVAATDEQARAQARQAFADHHDSFTYLWRQSGSERFSEPIDFDQLIDDGKLYVGSPETVTSLVTEAFEAGNVNYLAGSFAWGSLPIESSLQSLRRFRDEVIPAVRDAVGAEVPNVRR
jgi:alkanesulfonate monooxygenase SsuD/methylene tetrahydromethanopterin reductase-like flavin-dependent oxidoreductase (luciferase family)